MDAPLTPEEQRELDALENKHGSIGKANPGAKRVEVPDTFAGVVREHSRSLGDKISGKRGMFDDSPSDDAYSKYMLNAAAGSAMAKPEIAESFGTPFRAVGRGIRSLADFVGGKAAGMAPAEVAAYQKAPQLVEQIADEPALAQQARAESAMNATAGDLKNRVFGSGGIEEQLQATLGDRTVPEASLAEAGKYAPPRPQSYVDSQLASKGFDKSFSGIPEADLPGHARAAIDPRDVPLTEVYAKAREAAKNKNNWVQNPIDGSLSKATNPEAADAWSFLRNQTVKAAPEAESKIGELHDAVDTQKAIKSGFNRPAAFVQSRAVDTAAARQAADKMAGSTRLEDLSGQMNAAKAFKKAPSGLTDRLLQPVGRGTLKATSRAAPAASRAVDLAAPTASRLISRQLAPGLTQDAPLSPEEEQELRALEAQAQGK